MAPNVEGSEDTTVENVDKNKDVSDIEILKESSEDDVIKRQKLLMSRVEEYLFQNQDEDTINIDNLTTYLRRKYKDYRSKGSRLSTKMVSWAYDRIVEKLAQQGESLYEVSETDNEVPVKNKQQKQQNVTSVKNNTNGKIDATERNDESKKSETNLEIVVETVHDNFLNDLPMFEPIEMPGTNSLSTYTELNGTYVKKISDEKEPETQTKPQKSHKSKKKDKENHTTNSLDFTNKKKTKEFTVKNSTNTFSDIGGNEELLQRVFWKIKHLKYPDIVENYKKKTPPRGFLLYGPPGCGKTLLAHAIAGYLNIPLLEVAATDLVAGITGESEGYLRDLFDQVEAIAPCVLFLDKVDALATNRENAQKGMEKRIVDQLSLCLDKLSKSENRNKVLVLGATNQLESLDQSLRTPGRFEEEFCLGIPNKKARTSILKILTSKVNLAPEVSLEKISIMTPGYVASELDKLVDEAEDEALRRVWQANIDKPIDYNAVHNLTTEQLKQISIQEQDFEAALKIVKPSVKKEGGFISVPNVTWDDVGSLQNIREELSLDILAEIKYPNIYDGDSETETGILLCGPPGCGKTLLAKAMANEAGINFISVKGPEFLNKYVGESEKNVRKCFTQARNAAPCIIFFDELDALCPKRSEIDGNATSRVVNAMLTELDGVSDRKNVFVMAATNRPEIIDPALLRSGRFDKIIYVGLPKPEDRLDILRAVTKNGTKPKLSNNVNLKDIAFNERCEGFSGADLKGLVKQAKREYIRDKIKNQLETEHISREHFDRAFRIIKPTVKSKHMKRYKKLEKLYSVESLNPESSQNKKQIKRRCSSVQIIEEPLDSLFIKRVKRFIEKNKKQSTAETITGTANYMQNKYKDYDNEDIGTLRVKVRRVFNQLMGDSLKVIATPREIKQETNYSLDRRSLIECSPKNKSNKRPHDNNIKIKETPVSSKYKKRRLNKDTSKENELLEISDENSNTDSSLLQSSQNNDSPVSSKMKKKKKFKNRVEKIHIAAGCST